MRLRLSSSSATALCALLALVLGVGLAGCGGNGKPTSVPRGAVAVVGGQAIPQGQLNQLMNEARAYYQSQKQPFPKLGSIRYRNAQDTAINYLITSAEVSQQAKKLGVVVTPQQVTTQVESIKKTTYGGSEQKLEAAEAAQGLTKSAFEGEVTLYLLKQGVAVALDKGVTASDKDIQAYYQSHKKDYVTKESRDVRHILVKTKALADQIYAQLKAGADFTKLAKQYSQDTGSKASGGKLTIQKGQTVPQFETAAFGLKTNEISKPVHSQFGWHVIQALSPIRPQAQQTLAQAKATIQQTLTQKKQQTTVSTWLQQTTAHYCDGYILYAVGYQPTNTGCPAPTTTTSPTTT